jgi:hypothetical protein
VYSGVDLVPLLEQATRLQLGGGLSVNVNRNVSFYANADYQLAVGNTDGGVNGARNLPTFGGPIFPTWAGMVISPRCDRGSRS